MNIELRAGGGVRRFGIEPGTVVAEKYEVIRGVGRGWEGEVYLVREIGTGIERSLKFFYPQRNPANRKVRFYAKKLHKLRHCPILIQYHTQERVEFEGIGVTVLVSDFVEGELLSEFVKRQPGGRLDFFQALHLLHGLAAGIEMIHNQGEYHGDLHDENVIVRRHGLGFALRLVDLYHWGRPSGANVRNDVLKLIRLFYDCLGGARHYARQPQEIKDICCGLKHTLILQKYRTAGQLRDYLETMEWYTR